MYQFYFSCYNPFNAVFIESANPLLQRTQQRYSSIEEDDYITELEVQVEYLKQVIKGLISDNTKKDHKSKSLLLENIELKKQLKEKDAYILSVTDSRSDILTPSEYEPGRNLEINGDAATLNEELHFFTTSVCNRITQHQAYSKMEDSKKDIM